jgi:hypothetical protein
MVNRLVIAGREASNRISVPESVTARLNLRWMLSASSSKRTQPPGSLSDFDILLEGSDSDIMRAPSLGM